MDPLVFRLAFFDSFEKIFSADVYFRVKVSSLIGFEISSEVKMSILILEFWSAILKAVD